jgi:hypothetical protein
MACATAPAAPAITAGLDAAQVAIAGLEEARRSRGGQGCGSHATLPGSHSRRQSA